MLTALIDYKSGNLHSAVKAFEKIANELEENKTYLKRVNLYRDGEPLLDKKLGNRISNLDRKKIPNISLI